MANGSAMSISLDFSAVTSAIDAARPSLERAPRKLVEGIILLIEGGMGFCFEQVSDSRGVVICAKPNELLCILLRSIAEIPQPGD